MPKFKDGQTVRLKSGGPIMTVAFYDETMQQYHCVWFDKTNHKEGDFAETVLDEADRLVPGF